MMHGLQETPRWDLTNGAVDLRLVNRCWHRGGVILLILGSIPNSADPMVVWFFSFSGTSQLNVIVVWVQGEYISLLIACDL